MEDVNCDHFYAWSSPNGTRLGIGICVYCYMPDPEELEKMFGSRYNAFEICRRLSRALFNLEELRDKATTDSERLRLAGKIEGVKLVRSYIQEDLRGDG